MKILFICKYNRFRSKVAEAYFKKINKNKNLKVQSAGIIEVNKGLTPNEKKRNKQIKKEFDLNISSVSKGITAKLLESQDKIIVVASDVPKIIFDHWRWKEKVERWKAKDDHMAREKEGSKTVKFIFKKIDKLAENLK